MHTPYWPYWIVAPYSGGSQSIIYNASEEKDRTDLRVISKVPEENYKECVNSKDSKSFYDFTTEDVEKLNNVSFNDPEYKGKVSASNRYPEQLNAFEYRCSWSSTSPLSEVTPRSTCP